MGRRSVWSNPTVIAASKDFVAATDEVWRLQRGKDAECLHFQKMANHGHYGGGGGTRQGTYILTADGTFLASTNALSADAVVKVMAQGLSAWADTTADARKLPADWKLPRKRWETSCPTTGLVLRSFNADLGLDADRKRLNRDHAWFTAAEARGWLGTDPKPGDKHTVSKAIVERLARFHLVDNVRGQTLPFAPADVATSKITTTVTNRDGDAVSFEIHGVTKGETDGTWTLGTNDWTPSEKYPRAVTSRIVGHGRFDLASGRFTAIEFVAIGERTGRTNLNGRPKGDVGPARIGWVFELAPDRPAERVAPAFVDIYDADWIVDPR